MPPFTHTSPAPSSSSSHAGPRSLDMWATAPLRAVVAHIRVEFHAPLEATIAELTTLIASVCCMHPLGAGGAADPTRTRLERVRTEFAVLSRGLRCDMATEQEVIFPCILAGRPEEAAQSIRASHAQHHVVSEALVNLRRLTDDYAPPPDADTRFQALWRRLAEFDADLQVHMALEDELLFPRALRGDAVD